MKKHLQVVSMALLVMAAAGCVSQETKDLMGGVGGGLIGGFVGEKLGGKGGAIAGAVLGAALGSTLTHYLTKQDQANIGTVLDNPNTANTPVSWCSGSRSIQENTASECGPDGKTITMVPGDTKEENGRECRPVQLEVPDENGQIKSVTEKYCKSDNKGWAVVS